jgi:hypothetical protein
MISSRYLLVVVGSSLLAGGAAQAASTSCDKVGAADRAVALQQINNLMGRYAHLGQLRGEPTLGELFALKTEGVSWRTPTGPQGIDAIKSRFLKPGEAIPELPAGQLHTHSMLTPVIEIAGDGKTAKGVWDSFQPSVQNADDAGVWSWSKYGVDFVKEEGSWKIWHMQVYSIFSTPWGKSITQSAKERREAAANGGGGRAGGPPAGGGAGGPGMGGGREGWTGPKDTWRYDGLSAPRGPKIPEPYCTFDPKDSYGNV